jgi:UDP-3-O-[3-hydroxymyristoyl] glucosamine N-acyltransferase
MRRFTLDQIADLTGGRVVGDGSRVVTGALPPEAAGPDDLTFAFHAKALRAFLASPARAAVVAEGLVCPDRDIVAHRNPSAALAKILAAFHPEDRPPAGVHPSACVDPSASVSPGASVGPFAVVGPGSVIEDGAIVGAHCAVGAGCVVGAGTRLHPHAVLYDRTVLGRDCVIHSGVVLGADGFGFARAGGRHVKIPQVAGVVLGDDVEVGANTCIDRGTMTPTRIGTNTKVDNLVQIGHNCEIGDRVIVCGQTALAGSTIIEDDCTLAGQVGAAGHLRIGRGSLCAAGTGVTSDLPPGSRMAGHPPMPIRDWRRSQAALRHLPELRAEVRALRRRLDPSAPDDGPADDADGGAPTSEV